MKTFKELLMETPFGLDNNAYGVQHELGIGKELNPSRKFPNRPNSPTVYTKTGKVKVLPKSKSKLGTTDPAEVYHALTKDLSPENKKIHTEKALSAAQKLKSHFAGLGHKIKNVWWTSHPKDSHNLVKETNPGDLHIKTQDGQGRTKMWAISIKNYNKKKAPTLANPGHNVLDALLGTNTRKIWNDAIEQSHNHMGSMGVHTKHLSTAAAHQVENKHPKLKDVNKSFVREATGKISNVYRKQLSKMSPKEIAGVLGSVVRVEKTKTPVLKLSSYGPTKTGKYTHEIDDPYKEMQNIIREHGNHFHVDPLTKENSGNVAIHIRGQGGVPVITINNKGKGSGGFTAFGPVINGFHASAKKTTKK